MHRSAVEDLPVHRVRVRPVGGGVEQFQKQFLRLGGSSHLPIVHAWKSRLLRRDRRNVAVYSHKPGEASIWASWGGPSVVVAEHMLAQFVELPPPRSRRECDPPGG